MPGGGGQAIKKILSVSKIFYKIWHLSDLLHAARPEWMGSKGAKLGGGIPEGGVLEDHVIYGIKDS